MQIKAPYTLGAAVLVISLVAAFAIDERHDNINRVLNAPSVAGRGNAAPSSSSEGVAPAAEAGSPADRTLLERAQAGDARAQFRLADRMRECTSMVTLAERGYLNDVADQCKADNVPTGDWRPWREKALAAGDPIALMHAALEAKDDAAFAAAMDKAARSGDPEAQMALGHLLLTVDGVDTTDALAWMLVGCGDCTLDDPRLGMGRCVETGECPSNTRFVDYLATTHPEIAQEAQARAESLDALYEQAEVQQ